MAGFPSNYENSTTTTTARNNYTDTTNNSMTKGLIEELCKGLSFLAAWANERETERAEEQEQETNATAIDNDDAIARIVDLSKVVMDYLDDRDPDVMAPEVYDRFVYGCLFEVYKIPSVIQTMERDTLDFYDWWRYLIGGWIHGKEAAYRRLGWRHLTAMIGQVRREQSSPKDPETTTTENDHQPHHCSFKITGSRSRVLQGVYELRSRRQARRLEQQRPLYHNNILPVGRTVGLYRCTAPTTSSNKNRNSKAGCCYGHWFLTKINNNNDENKVPYTGYNTGLPVSLARNAAGTKRKRNHNFHNKPPWNNTKELFSPPVEYITIPTRFTGLPHSDDATGAASSSGASEQQPQLPEETHEQRLADWIVAEDILARGWSMPTDAIANKAITTILEMLLGLHDAEESRKEELLVREKAAAAAAAARYQQEEELLGGSGGGGSCHKKARTNDGGSKEYDYTYVSLLGPEPVMKFC